MQGILAVIMVMAYSLKYISFSVSSGIFQVGLLSSMSVASHYCDIKEINTLKSRQPLTHTDQRYVNVCSKTLMIFSQIVYAMNRL